VPGNNGQDIFRRDDGRQLFLSTLTEACSNKDKDATRRCRLKRMSTGWYEKYMPREAIDCMVAEKPHNGDCCLPGISAEYGAPYQCIAGYIGI